MMEGLKRESERPRKIGATAPVVIHTKILSQEQELEVDLELE